MVHSPFIKAMLDGAYFFVGAGASRHIGKSRNKEPDFPLGSCLLKKFHKELEDPASYLLPHQPPEPQREWAEEIIRARNEAPDEISSIDALLNEAGKLNYDELIEFGRWFVDHEIGQAERQALQKHGDSIVVPWLERLLDFITEGAGNYEDAYMRVKTVGDDYPRLCFGTLNYDRVIEFSLWNYMKKRFPDSEPDIRDDMTRPGSIVLHHHGCLGTLLERPFGETASSQKPSIRFWFEKSADPKQWPIQNRLIEIRKRLIIIGFGFHREITSRLLFQSNEKKIYMTDFVDNSESQIQIQHFLEQLKLPMAVRVTGANCCFELIEELIRNP